jgi:hypothetical protein
MFEKRGLGTADSEPSAKLAEGFRACPWCAEPIRQQAVICRFCNRDVTGKVTVPQTVPTEGPTLLRVMVANIVFPGAGAWKLGHRPRAAIIAVLVLGCLAVYTQHAMAQVDRLTRQVMRTKRVPTTEEIRSAVGESPWGEAAFWIYAVSFADLFWLHRRKQMELSPRVPEKPGRPA